MSELLWIAVPQGLRPASKASLRVLVVPRLTTVDIAEAGLADWPTTLTDEVSFSMRTRTSVGERIAVGRPQLVTQARSDVWEGFFGGDAGLVNEYQPKTNPVPNVSPTHADATRAAQTYRSVTRAAADPDTDANAAIRNALTGWAAPEPAVPAAGSQQPVFTTPDFHATVSKLREHPTVMLQLGLVFELIVNVADLNLGAAAAGRQLSIRCTDPPFLRGLVTSPWTRYDLTATDFRPAAATGAASAIRAGMLDLSDSASVTSPNAADDPRRWAVATFDVDGVVGNLRQTGRDVADAAPAAAVMPPMRSVGLALLRPNRGTDFEARIAAAGMRGQAPLAETAFAAEDLVLGYRVDIRREDNPWRSTCERNAQYTVNGVVMGAPGALDGHLPEESHVKPFAAVRDGDGGLQADETVLRWDGWSFALPTPNLRADTPGPATDPNRPLPYRFEWDFQIPGGRLPALRFADRYQMRIRIADLAGGGLGLDEVDDDETASDSITYRRHDPIQPPALRAIDDQFTPGAAIDVLVIRSDNGQPDPDYPPTETRALDPPTAPLQLIEQHRMLDGLSDEQSFELAQRAMRADAAGSGLPDPAAEGINAYVPAEPGGLDQPRSRRIKWVPSWPNQRPKSIELAGHVNLPDPVTINWVGDTLKVTLAKAEQATIEFSSTIRGDMEDHLAMTDYLRNPPVPDRSIENTKLGRNPVVTPARRVLVVHAVKKPLAEPLWKSPLPVDRGPGDVAAVLKPTFTIVDSGAGLNTDSTGRLDVAASWTEFEDVGAEAGAGQRAITVEHLNSQSIARTSQPEIALQIRHEFGDTKHRWVTYNLNATSRFRQYFKDAESESSFQLSRKQDRVNILSTARPTAPVVLGIVPAFRWQRSQPAADRIEHVRRSQRLRVELSRPWFQTGEGEQLAVVLAPGDNDPAALSELVTRIGRDPLFGSPDTPARPRPDWFPNAAAAQQIMLTEINAAVIAMPFDVTPAGDRWFADIDFAAPAAQFYNPFVQLAVARYQRDSIDGLRLSPVVVTDRVPLLPNRRVVVSRVGNQITITVDGTSPNPLNRLEAILEACPPGIAPESLDVIDEGGGEPQISAWRPVVGASVVRAAGGAIPPLTLPATPGRLRVRLRESEDRLTEPAGGASTDLLRRNVFVDTIVLPAAWQPA